MKNDILEALKWHPKTVEQLAHELSLPETQVRDTLNVLRHAGCTDQDISDAWFSQEWLLSFPPWD